MHPVHISPFSGSWYPAGVAELEGLLEERFEQSGTRTGSFFFGDALGYVVPHAGPAYSGAVAAAAYRSLRQQAPERIVVLAFPHRGGLRGVAVPDLTSVSTPLGDVAIDTVFDGQFERVPEARVCDHSFEIQLPFLQKAAPRARIAPLYVGELDAGRREQAASALAALWRPGTVFLASSDFTHYGRSFGYTPFPADRAISARLHDLDFEYIDAAGSLDAALFLDTLAETHATVCGSGPIALLLETLSQLRGESVYQVVLDYQTSGDITADFQHSVSYAALGYYPREAFDLDAADREALLDSAARTLAHLRETGVREPFPAEGSPRLQGHQGVFVSLHQGDDLLGCLGNCSSREPLATHVSNLTLSAALEDPRFRPAAGVSGSIDIEISVLTPFRRIRDQAKFQAGRHGAMLTLAHHKGLLLPQVAADQNWSAGQFLAALALKSSLGPHALKDPQARLSVFEAQVFSRRCA